VQRLETAGPGRGITDLGALTPPLLFFGGPYSNLHATEALIRTATDLGIPASSCICTGDIVAYGAHPQETAEAIRAFGCHVVRGNCEDAFASQSDACGCGFAEGSRCDVLSTRWLDYAQRSLSDPIRAWMADLPDGIRFSVDGVRFFATHGAPSQVNRFVFHSTDTAIKEAEFSATGADIIIAGHCGIPFSTTMGTQTWHNPGVIGLPANDGTPRTWFSVLHKSANGLRIETKSLEYDFAAAQTAMRTATLPEEYAATISSGLWDNCDVLPVTETHAQGQALDSTTVTISQRTPESAASRP
jgi:predicted phosphodiesterase